MLACAMIASILLKQPCQQPFKVPLGMAQQTESDTRVLDGDICSATLMCTQCVPDVELGKHGDPKDQEHSMPKGLSARQQDSSGEAIA